jgi:RES domain-containing protein
MMIAWRLVRAAALTGSFTGEGASKFGGRWNSKGVAVVYMSESLALASLELFARLGKKDKNDKFMAVPVEIPSDIFIKTIYVNDLPKTWREMKKLTATRNIGDRWVKEGVSAVLKVPSVIVPSEFNLIANPHHVDFPKIKPGNPQPFSFDIRLWK